MYDFVVYEVNLQYQAIAISGLQSRVELESPTDTLSIPEQFSSIIPLFLNHQFQSRLGIS